MIEVGSLVIITEPSFLNGAVGLVLEVGIGPMPGIGDSFGYHYVFVPSIRFTLQFDPRPYWVKTSDLKALA